ncbi:adenosylcobinamide amidohydrolase [Halobaculum sp. CBA1158]|uniref:adenosylcobinamide amidohydrolase n=1 Tax=Halobaculum sp. CBA1158 TaxID=2904243 RepID=UPI001F3D2DE4|nr:adenosylcobinamide amidohydrolase [Halobaculum sp. CBA1158]UIP00290.1 adenosylcobinamide amidohydrolase [Halobaculum sp. CBA1158]
MTFETRVADGVLRLGRPDTRWLSTGWAGGFADAPAAYNVSVPEGWTHTDLDAYVARRRTDAGFEPAGPTLLTGVDMCHARLARAGPVVAVATAGVSNPAALPMRPEKSDRGVVTGDDAAADEPVGRGTVNVLVATTRRLDDGALANLVAVAAEAKAATLLSATGFPGTTTDAVVAGSARDGEPARFSGSATPVGSAARACVRDAVAASLDARYADDETATLPDSVADAEHGVVTDRETEVFEP